MYLTWLGESAFYQGTSQRLTETLSNTKDQLLTFKRYYLEESSSGASVPVLTSIVAMQDSVVLGMGILVSDAFHRQ